MQYYFNPLNSMSWKEHAILLLHGKHLIEQKQAVCIKTSTQVFSREYCEIFKYTYFEELLQTAASGSRTHFTCKIYHAKTKQFSEQLLRALENFWFCDDFKGYRKRPVTRNGSRKIIGNL